MLTAARPSSFLEVLYQTINSNGEGVCKHLTYVTVMDGGMVSVEEASMNLLA